MSPTSTFTAAMIQMRTGLLPEPSLEQGIGLIREAAAQGADYVQTPEVSNMMQLNRKALFEHLASEEDDKSLKAYREQMYSRAGEGTTFPQIFIGATHVGGCDELYALDRAGKLDAMLAGEKASS